MVDPSEVKLVLKASLVANPMKTTVRQLYNFFKESEGYEVPYREFGFSDFGQYLLSIPDTVQVIGAGPQAEVRVIVSKKSAHIVDMVAKQKTTVRKPPRVGRFGRNFQPNYYNGQRAPPPRPTRANPVYVSQYHPIYLAQPVPLMSLNPMMYNQTRNIMNQHVQGYKNTSYNQFPQTGHPITNRRPPGAGSHMNSARNMGDLRDRLNENHLMKQTDAQEYTATPTSMKQNGLPTKLEQSPVKPVNAPAKLENSSPNSPAKSTYSTSKPANSPAKSRYSPPKQANSPAKSRYSLPKPAYLPIKLANSPEKVENSSVKLAPVVHPEVPPSSGSSDYDTSEEILPETNNNAPQEPIEVTVAAAFEPDKVFISDDESDINYKVPFEVQRNMKQLIGEYPDGIWCSKMPEIYKKRFNKELNYLMHGYRSLVQMCADLSYIFNYQQADKGDFKLYDRRKPIPANEFMMLKELTSMQKEVREYKPKKPVLPDDIKCILLHGVGSYPDDVFTPRDFIPRQSIAEKENDYVDILIAEIYDPSKFWFNLLRTSEHLDSLMDEMQEFYKYRYPEYAIPSYALEVGLYCTAVFSNEFHRAKVCNMLPQSNTNIKVFFIDYGTVASVAMEGICYLHKTFGQLPAQAIKGRLARIYPPEVNQQWTRDSATRFLDLIKEKRLVAQIDRIDEMVNHQVFEMIVADTNGNDDIFINDTLVYDGHARFFHQGQEVSSLSADYVPLVRYIHLYPTFEELEGGDVPTAYEMGVLNITGVPLNVIYPHYYKKTGVEEVEDSQWTSDIEIEEQGSLTPEPTAEQNVEVASYITNFDETKGAVKVEELVKESWSDGQTSSDTGNLECVDWFKVTGLIQEAPREESTDSVPPAVIVKSDEPKLIKPPPGFEFVKPENTVLPELANLLTLNKTNQFNAPIISTNNNFTTPNLWGHVNANYGQVYQQQPNPYMQDFQQPMYNNGFVPNVPIASQYNAFYPNMFTPNVPLVPNYRNQFHPNFNMFKPNLLNHPAHANEPLNNFKAPVNTFTPNFPMSPDIHTPRQLSSSDSCESKGTPMTMFEPPIPAHQNANHDKYVPDVVQSAKVTYLCPRKCDQNNYVEVVKAMDQVSLSDTSSSVEATMPCKKQVTRGVIGDQYIFVVLFRKKPHALIDEVQRLFFPAIKTILQLKRALRRSHSEISLDSINLEKHTELHDELLSTSAIQTGSKKLDVVPLEHLPDFINYFGKYVPAFNNYQYVLELYAYDSNVWYS